MRPTPYFARVARADFGDVSTSVVSHSENRTIDVGTVVHMYSLGWVKRQRSQDLADHVDGLLAPQGRRLSTYGFLISDREWWQESRLRVRSAGRDELVGSERQGDGLESISTDVSERGTGPACPTVAPPCKQGQMRQAVDLKCCKDAGM